MAKNKKKSNGIPAELKESAQKIWLAGLGALATAEEEGGKLFNNLVKKGEGFEERGKKAVREASEKVSGRVEEVRDRAESTIERMGDTFDEKVGNTLKRLGVPTREEIQKLTKRVEELTAKVDQLKPARRAAASKKAQAKSA